MVASTSVLLIINMERNQPRDRFISLRKKIAISTVLAASLSAGVNELNMSGHEPTPERVYSQDIFTPIIIPESNNYDSRIIPYSNLIVELPKPLPVLSKEEKREAKINQELEKVVDIMKDTPNTFSKKYIKDVKIYYPIYKTVADKYNMDWYLLFIVHEKETGASAGTRGFLQSSYYKGAMQRDPNTWDQGFVNKSAKELGDLAHLPQRHKDDWKEIAAGAAILERNIVQYKSEGIDVAVHKSLLLYSANGPAEKRFALYKKYKNIFSN